MKIPPRITLPTPPEDAGQEYWAVRSIAELLVANNEKQRLAALRKQRRARRERRWAQKSRSKEERTQRVDGKLEDGKPTADNFCRRWLDSLLSLRPRPIFSRDLFTAYEAWARANGAERPEAEGVFCRRVSTIVKESGGAIERNRVLAVKAGTITAENHGPYEAVATQATIVLPPRSVRSACSNRSRWLVHLGAEVRAAQEDLIHFCDAHARALDVIRDADNAARCEPSPAPSPQVAR